MILDSGNRTEFDSGAVRDMREGKGRCDLLPMDVVFRFYELCKINEEEPNNNLVFYQIDRFMQTGDFTILFDALVLFDRYNDIETLLLEVAIHFEEGAKKYGDRNWQKGIPVRCYIDSATRHYLKYLRGDTDEPHDRAFCWNILCAIWTCIHKPELNEYAPATNELPGQISLFDDKCVCCGAVIPEGSQVCKNCWEDGFSYDKN